MGRMLDIIERLVARHLQTPVAGHEPLVPSDPAVLHDALKPCDVLLVEGNDRISAAIKYLTQSTWSHAALYVGPITGTRTEAGEPHVLIEANLGEGVVTAPLSKYHHCHTRICRPAELHDGDRARVCRYALDRVGLDYDLKNIIDLARHLLPSPVPRRWRQRRRMTAFGSGDPNRIICTALIAQAFEAVRYPILPTITRADSGMSRHSTLYAPRDFDNSPYFTVVKPTVECGFDYRDMCRADRRPHVAIESDPVPFTPEFADKLSGWKQPA